MVHRLLFNLRWSSLTITLFLTAVFLPVLQAQNQIVLGDSAISIQLAAGGNSTLLPAWSSCSSAGCLMAQGSAYGEGVFASANGSYSLSVPAGTQVSFALTAGGGASSFTATQTGLINFAYTSAQGTLTGTLALVSLEQGNASATANLVGELTVTGGSLASNLADQAAEADFIVPVSGALGAAVENGDAVEAQIGFPSVVTLAPASAPACPVCRDFVTGGGWITDAVGDHANFGVHGGIRNGGFWGHLEFNDHSSAPPLMVKSTAITGYRVLSDNTREIDGMASVNGQSGFSFRVVVTDADNGGEGPGPNHADQFSLTLSNGYTVAGSLGGGDIEIHGANCEQQNQKQSGECDVSGHH